MLEQNQFDIIANLPWIVFAILFFINFVVFIIGSFRLLLSKDDPLKIEKGKKTLKLALIMMILIIIMFLAFMLITYLVRKGEALKPQAASADFPPPDHLGIFPPVPNYIKISSYYFVGPYSLQKNNYIIDSAISAILCKSGEDYKTIYVAQTSVGSLLNNSNYKCWVSNCENSSKNLYVAVFWTPQERYNSGTRNSIIDQITEEIAPVCSQE